MERRELLPQWCSGHEDSGEFLSTDVSSERVSIQGSGPGLVALAELFGFYATIPEGDDHTHWWCCPESQLRLLTIVLSGEESKRQSAEFEIDSHHPERLFVTAGCKGMQRLENAVRAVIASGHEKELLYADGLRGPHRSLVFGKAPELGDATHSAVKALCEAGDRLAEQEHYQAAIRRYDEAFNLLPNPKLRWEAATWVLCALGEAYFFEGDFARSEDAFMGAVRAPDGLGNPFIHLRLGECAFELGNNHLAEDELARAYLEAGREIFADEDPKYFQFLETVL